MSSHPRHFVHDRAGSSTIQFVVIFGGLMALIFFVMETTLYLFFSASLEKAAQAGARAAVVSAPVAAGLPDRNQRKPAGLFGIPCSNASAPCVGYATATCTGNGCAAGDFDRIFTHMSGFSGQLEPGNVTVTYADTQLGYAGGPIVPLVTVRVANVPYQTGIVGLLLTNAGVLSSLPAHASSLTGEDLN
jgi:Flp pilus assembly protein TadG